MSDSELSDVSVASSLPPSRPSDSKLELELSKCVRNAVKAGNQATVTVALMRKQAEEALGLESGFYKQDKKWREESKRIVHETYAELEALESTPSKPDETPVAKVEGEDRKSSKIDLSKKRKISGDDNGGNDDGPPKKRRTPESDSSSITSSNNHRHTQQPRHRSTESGTGSGPKEAQAEAQSQVNKVEQLDKIAPSESDLSVLEDEEPTRNSTKRQGTASRPKKKKNREKPPTASGQGRTDDDPDQTEVKRLQGWLVKCGVRKLWGKELKPYGSPKAKIKHLRDMLAEVGMTGRYSIQKASAIKEERELKADIEAVQEGAQRWGRNPAQPEKEVAETVPDKRTGRNRAPRVLDFLSDDAEETD